MKKILTIIFIILAIILTKLVLYFAINELIIFNYNNHIYNDSLIKVLYPLNYNQSYIAYYNEGNIMYRKGKYEEAINKYKKALDKKPPKKKVCDVRINLSLAMVYNITSTDKDEIYNELEKAKNVLYENHCADSEDNSGYSQDAEQLEEEIKELQEKLNEQNNDQPDQPDDNTDPEPEEDYSDIEEQLAELERESNENRQENMTSYEYMGNYEYYDGKKW